MANQRLWLARALRAKRGAETAHRRKVGKSYNKICSETRGGFRASFGRGDPCTRYQAQSCAQRTTLLSVSYKSGFHFQLFEWVRGIENSGSEAESLNRAGRCNWTLTFILALAGRGDRASALLALS